jgi:inorganic pyrophosphatase
LAEDNDPLDILVLASTKTFPGCIVDARVIGYLDMMDNDEKDQKIIAVMDKDPRFEDIHAIEDVKKHTLREVRHFFQTYKDLQENKKVEVYDFHPKEDALKLIKECQIRYQEQKK